MRILPAHLCRFANPAENMHKHAKMPILAPLPVGILVAVTFPSGAFRVFQRAQIMPRTQ